MRLYWIVNWLKLQYKGILADMAKYIDLLRTHQEKSPSSLTAHKDNEISDESLLNEDAGIQETDTHTSDEQLLADEVSSTIEDLTEHESPSKNTPPSGWLSECTQHTLDIFQHAQQESPISISVLKKCIATLLTKLNASTEQDMIDALELNIAQQVQQIRHIHEDLGSLVQKSIMMMLYTIKTGQRLKLNHEELKTQVLAAMLHHIGMAQISSEIRNKKDKLSKSELESIRQAPQRSYDFLKACDVSDDSILQAASGASERYDGSGPKGLSGSEIAWSARLISVISMFEALIHYRPYRARLLPRDAIREIVKNHKKSFDPTMLKALIESISLYPVGTYVELNSGEIGLVTRIHPRLPLRPVVDVRMDKQGNSAPPRQVDLKEYPNIVVEKCMYEEALRDLGSNNV